MIQRWNAQWVGLTVSETETPTGFCRALFTCEFECNPASLKEVSCRLAADSRYAMYLNGRLVARGNQRVQPRRKKADVVNIKDFLIDGLNIVSILVTFYGQSNAVWQAPVPSGLLGRGPALLFETNGLPNEVVTGPHWNAARMPAWSSLPSKGLEGVAPECLDARLLPADWANRNAKKPAVIAVAGHRGKQGLAHPPLSPYGTVADRATPMTANVAKYPCKVSQTTLSIGSHSDRPGVYGNNNLAGALQSIGHCDSPPDDLMPVSKGEAVLAVADFGGIVSGFPTIDIAAPAGTIIDILYLERLTAADDFGPHGGSRYICRGYQDRFEAQEQVGFRYLVAIAMPQETTPVTFGSFAVDENLQPWEEVEFSCSDREIEAIWKAGIRTAQLNTCDAFTDCPTREKRFWVGDGVVTQLAHLSANRDWRMARSYVEVAGSPREDGLLPMSVAGDLEARNGVTIPSYSLHWIHGWYELWQHLGPCPEVENGLALAQRILQWFTDYETEDGVLTTTGEWDLFDWSHVIVRGESATLTALYARGLQEFMAVADGLGATTWVRSATSTYARLKRGFEKFWDNKRGLYVDSVENGHRIRSFSQVTNAAAVVSGIVPETRIQPLLERISAPESLLPLSYLGSPATGVDHARWERVATNELVIDWDVDAHVVRAEPFFSYVVHDAYQSGGRPDLVLRAIRDWSRFLRDGYDSFGESWGWGTKCHSWSTTPVKDMIRSIAGVTPLSPGFAQIKVQPHLGTIESLKMSVPLGGDEVALTYESQTATVVSPVPGIFVHSTGETSPLVVGKNVFPLGGPGC